MAALAACVAAAPAPARTPSSVEVVVTLRAPALADAAVSSRALAAFTTRGRRLQLASPASVGYLQRLDREQTAVAQRIAKAIPGAYVHWRYSVTLNGLAVVVPRGSVARLALVPGVARIWSSATYSASLDRTPQLIGAPIVWGPTLSNAGQGMKIGIIDQGIDQTHPFFNPAGYQYPAGYPKGNAAFTTPKVIVARSFVPPGVTGSESTLPFANLGGDDEHGTHVAGIAAGDHGTMAPFFSTQPLSGVAPAAYLGNYKALAVPSACCGLDGNAPEIAKAIDQAVADGMDVINLSLGEPEIDPARDIVVKAIDGAAKAGVVPCIAAGNEGGNGGKGSVGSPADAPAAITTAAATTGRGVVADVIANFSSVGPTPYSLNLKPDVTAPGVNVLSSLPKSSWAEFNGTSMASPHVAGAAALLRQAHPTWTVPQIKSALMLTGDPVYTNATRTVQASTLFAGGGRINVARATNPLVFAAPSSASFGLMKRGAGKTIKISLSDAGGGAGEWTVALAHAAGEHPTVSASVTVPGTLTVSARIAAGAAEGDGTGLIALRRGTDVRQIPYWLHVEVPRLAKPTRVLSKTGTYSGNNRNGKARVSSYRYPEGVRGVGLPGPEQVFAVHLRKPVANLGVRVVSQARNVEVTPRVVRNGDENRLTGYVGLPGDLNPYRESLGDNVPIAGAILPGRGTYDIVFDSAGRVNAGNFTFRFWLNDVTPPSVKLLGYSGGVLRLAISDRGSGVDAGSIIAGLDGNANVDGSYARGVLSIRTGSLSGGKHTIEVDVSDYQEAKNMEDVLRILPNTRVFKAAFTAR
ncbi:MAG: S8 family peptidase [Gaiellaceae bacterium]